MSSTFHKYGGFSAVSRIVLDFYEMVLDSDVVGHHFDNVDMPRLMDHQTKFVSSLMGGPASISDDRLKQVHHRLDISPDEFVEIVDLLSKAMGANGMEDRDIREVARVFETKKHLIIARGS